MDALRTQGDAMSHEPPTPSETPTISPQPDTPAAPASVAVHEQDTVSVPAPFPQPSATVPPELADHPRYRVVRLLGQGGMGAVYLAEHRVMLRLVALKVMRADLVRDDAAVDR